MRNASRALIHIIGEVYGGWTVPSLSVAADTVRSSIQSLLPWEPGQTCPCCGRSISSPTMRVFDAGQAYEMIKIDVVTNDLDHMAERARSSGKELIQVMKSVKCITGRSMTLQRDMHDRSVYKLMTIIHCAKCFLVMRFYRMGDRFLMQLEGVPIGGPMSGALLRLVLSRRECAFDQAVWPTFATRNLLRGPRSKWLATGRYEDDVILISNRLCSTCVDGLIPSIYEDVVPFGVCHDYEFHSGTSTSNKFLDFVITLMGKDITIDLHHPNLLFALHGNARDMLKQRFSPHIGPRNYIISRLTQNFACRRARWTQLRFDKACMVRAFCIDILELLRIGYDCKTIRQAWKKSQSHDAGYLVGHQILSCLPRLAENTCDVDFVAELSHIAAALHALYGVSLPLG